MELFLNRPGLPCGDSPALYGVNLRSLHPCMVKTAPYPLILCHRFQIPSRVDVFAVPMHVLLLAEFFGTEEALNLGVRVWVVLTPPLMGLKIFLLLDGFLAPPTRLIDIFWQVHFQVLCES